MKKYFLLLGLLLPLGLSAQTTIEEEFNGSSTLEWTQFSDKRGKVVIQNDGMFLSAKKATKEVSTSADIPIETDQDFIIEAELIIPKIASFTCFGIKLNEEAAYIMGKKTSYIYSQGEWTNQRIKLNISSNNTITLGLKYTNSRCVAILNNMEIGELHIAEGLTNPRIEFYTNSSMYIKSLKITQY